jgi:hypothetical protein
MAVRKEVRRRHYELWITDILLTTLIQFYKFYSIRLIKQFKRSTSCNVFSLEHITTNRA